MNFSKREALLPLLAIFCLASAAHGQLQITEIMADATNNNDWEWVEIHNPTANAVSLNEHFFDDIGNASPEDALPNISDQVASTAIVPAGGVAVVYDGFGLDYDDTRFRSAWSIPTTVPVIAADFFPSLNNGGDAIGFWPSRAAYELDTMDVDGMGDIEVVQFNNATLSIDFRTDFPIPDKVSLTWNGAGSFQDGANWAASEVGVGGALTSTQTFFEGMEQLNSESDFGNPGVAPSGTASGLVISEMMVNPSSSEPQWEWMEVVNGTGSAIDFASTPYVFDEEGGSALTEANITQGSIPDGGVAVLFNGGTGGVTVADMEAAWGAGNYIPVDSWQSLNNGNGGDFAGIWDALGTPYTDDKEAVAGGASGYPNAVASATYDGTLDDGSTSFSLTSLDADPTDPANWVLSTTGSNANPVFLDGQATDHDGGEIGSPGQFSPGVVSGPTCDFDADGDCELDDIDSLYASGAVTSTDINGWLSAASSSNNTANPNGLTLVVGDIDLSGNVNSTDLGLLLNNFGLNTATSWGQGDLDDDGNVNSTDLGLLLNNFGFSSSAAAAQVPEPGSLSLLILAALGFSRSIRRRR